jgi:SAM-dependent methyltransferase
MPPAEPSPPPSPSAPGPADCVGAATLERMAAAPRYNRWMFERLRRWVGRRVLEIGAGIGNMSAFLADRERVVLTDTEDYYLGRLRERFAGQRQVTVTALRLPAVEPRLRAERLDTVVCLNVLEHIEDDRASLAAMHDLLQPGGRLVLLVPSLRALYGTLDEALGHFRRYTRRELSTKLEGAGFRVRHLEYFNLAGVPGWWFAGRVLRRRLIPSGALRWYEALVPLFRLEALLPWRIGQSLIAIGEVPG